MGEVDDGFHLRSAVGVSLFVDTPLAPLRFNYSVPLQKEEYDVVERFRFTIESRF
jgi:outer membrane protein insertion porin family